MPRPTVRARVATGPFGRLARRLLTVGLTLLLTAAAVAGYAAAASVGAGPEIARANSTNGGPSGAGTTTLVVNMTDNGTFDPSDLSAVAATTVNFELVNVGSFNHSFSLSDQPNATINRTLSPAGLYAYFATNAEVNITVAPMSTHNFSLDIPAAWAGDSFEFVSIVPYQFQAGMLGFLNVTSAGGGASYTVTDHTASGTTLAFVPDAIEINATAFPIHVEVEVSNLGSSLSHTWTLVAQPNTNMTPSGFTSYFQAHPPAVSLSIPAAAGQVITGNFTLDAKGTYQFLCEVPGHFSSGMDGYLYVGVPAPAVAAPPSTAVVEVWLLGGAAAVLAIGVFLAVVAAFVGRFPETPKGKGHH